GHKPVIGLGARSAYRSEWLPLSQRWSRDGLLQRVAPWMVTPEWEREATPENAGPIQAGKPITLNQRGVALYGFDHMQAIRNGPRKKSPRCTPPTAYDGTSSYAPSPRRHHHTSSLSPMDVCSASSARSPGTGWPPPTPITRPKRRGSVSCTR